MGCASHIGGRAEQQDSVICLASRDGRARLLVVADGMGGHRGGELASQTVIETVLRLWDDRRRAPDDPAAFLDRLCREADQSVRETGRAHGLTPHSTIAALLATRERAYWTHVGDSRIYAFRGDKPVFRSEDHTVVQNLVRAGRIREDEAYTHPEQHKLLRGLGGDTPTTPTAGQMRLTPETGFLLCTDGFWATVRPEEMPALLAAQDPQTACEHWVALAARRGGRDSDNVTVAVLRPSGRTELDHRALWPLYAALAFAIPAFLYLALR
jgi:serine/threonine protein phosphatase PrpC